MSYIKPTDKDKPWAKRQIPEKRELRAFEVKNLFRIFCEGENTEPEYFKSFPVNTETKVEAIGLGRSKTALVEKAIELLAKESMLSKKLHCNYEEDGKSKNFSQSLYSIFLPFQQNAIQHATRLYEEKKLLNFCEQNPCTTVFQLVENLNKCLKK